MISFTIMAFGRLGHLTHFKTIGNFERLARDAYRPVQCIGEISDFEITMDNEENLIIGHDENRE